jgi:GT2 family glycosyltransferase
MSTAIAAVLLAYNRKKAVDEVLHRLSTLPVDEVVVVDNGSDGTGADLRARDVERVVVVDPGGNVGIAGRNRGAEATDCEFSVVLDDDSYALPGAVEGLRAAFDHKPRLAVVGGLVRDVAPDKRVLLDEQMGTFDWWLRGGATGPPPPDGFPAFFFPEGGCMVRRSAFLEVGGFYEPFFFASNEVELATRFLAAGWDVRYLPTAEFDHMKVPGGRDSLEGTLRRRIRNQIWYFWLRFPADIAIRRIIAYGLFDLFNCLYRGVPKGWFGGVADAWRDRAAIRGDRHPVPRKVVKRTELKRGAMHRQLLAERARERLGGRESARRRRLSDPWDRKD